MKKMTITEAFDCSRDPCNMEFSGDGIVVEWNELTCLDNNRDSNTVNITWQQLGDVESLSDVFSHLKVMHFKALMTALDRWSRIFVATSKAA